MVLLESLPEVIINKIKSYVIFTPNNKELKRAVNLWCEDKTKAYKLFGHISFWDTKQVTNMYKLFFSKFNFNSVISSWDVSNVTDMHSMFNEAKSFNQTLNNWDVSNVTDMRDMFRETYKFNQPLDNWDVSNVTNMKSMFDGTKSLTKLPEWYKKKLIIIIYFIIQIYKCIH